LDFRPGLVEDQNIEPKTLGELDAGKHLLTPIKVRNFRGMRPARERWIAVQRQPFPPCMHQHNARPTHFRGRPHAPDCQRRWVIGFVVSEGTIERGHSKFSWREFRPLLDLVEVAVVRNQRLVGFFVGLFAHKPGTIVTRLPRCLFGRRKISMSQKM
jgi:hypothetical protein